MPLQVQPGALRRGLIGCSRWILVLRAGRDADTGRGA